jgi:hypothetical protein
MPRGNQLTLLVFGLIFNLRLLTELPRSLELMGWITPSESDYNRIVSMILLAFCLFCIALKRVVSIAPSQRFYILVVLCWLLM